MPRAHPPEFRQRAVELARLREKPIVEIAEDLGISESCLRSWMHQADIDDGRRRRPDRATNAPSWSSCAASCGSRRWRTRSSSGRRRTSPGRTSSQNDLHLHRRALLGSAGRGVLSGDEGVDLGLLRVASPPGQRPRLGRRGADEHDRRHPPDVPPLLWDPRGCTPSSASAHGDALLAQAGRAADAPSRRGRASIAGAGAAAPAATRPRAERRSRQPPVRPRRPGPAVGHGRHRTPDRRRQGLPGGRPRRLVSRRVVGWSIADHIRSELVVDALQMAIWRRQPPDRPDRRPLRSRLPVHVMGVRPTAPRRRPARLDGHRSATASTTASPRASSAPCNSSSSTNTTGHTREQLALAIFDWIEAWYNPRRRHSYCDMLSPIDYETADRGMITTTHPSARTGGSSPEAITSLARRP